MFPNRRSSILVALSFVTTIAALGCEGCCGSKDQSDAGPAPTVDAASDSPAVDTDAGPMPDAMPAPDASDAAVAQDANSSDAPSSIDAAQDADDCGTGMTDAGPDAQDASDDAAPAQDAGPAPDAAPADAGSDAAIPDAGPQPFGCTGWTRDTGFDALQFAGSAVQAVGYMAAPSATDVYVPIGVGLQNAVAHRANGTWAIETVPNNPSAISASVWGSSASDVWLTGYDMTTAAGYLAHRQSGQWVLDPNAPAALMFSTVWGADANTVFIGGSATDDTAAVWKRMGTDWTKQSLPVIAGWSLYAINNLWGADATHVFASAAALDASQTVTKGFVLFSDGTSWTDLEAPSALASVTWVQGSSSSDVFVLGTATDGSALVYHGNGQASGWQAVTWSTPLASDTLISPANGAALIGSTVSPETSGSGRLTIVQQGTQLRTESIDSQAGPPRSLAQVPGTDTVLFDHIGVQGTNAGIYAGTCH